MRELVLRYNREISIKPLVDEAIRREIGLLEVGIQKTRHNLEDFEKKYSLKTEDFLDKIKRGDLSDESIDFTDWVGEYHLLLSLEEKKRSLEGVEICP